MRTRKTRKQTDSLKARFDTAHRLGMDSLKAGDYNGVDRAIKVEKAVIAQQGRRIQAFMARQNKSRNPSK